MKKVKDKKQYTKLFYQFLVNEGKLFEFLKMLGATKYSTLEKHCNIVRPENYILKCIQYTNIFERRGMWYVEYVLISQKWNEHLQQYKTRQK